MSQVPEHIALLLNTARTSTSRFSGLREYFSETLKWRQGNLGPLDLTALLTDIAKHTALPVEAIEYDTLDDFSYRIMALAEKHPEHIAHIMSLGAADLPGRLLQYCLEDALSKIKKAEKGTVL